MRSIRGRSLFIFLPAGIERHVGFNSIRFHIPEKITGCILVPALKGIALSGGWLRSFQQITVHLILSGDIAAGTGANYECDAIAACVIGGVSFVGGTGKISGIVLGVFVLRIIFIALTMLGVSSSSLYIIKGAIILCACALDMRKYLVKK